MSSRYYVLIGEDEFQVDAGYTKKAEYEAAKLFRDKHHLNCPLVRIAHLAITADIPIPKFTTEGVLALLAKMEEEVLA